MYGMSGHSKWSQIKRQKGVADAARGAAFTKAANAITVAAREGGGDPETNFKLRLAIEAAKGINMPKENIKRAIARGGGAGKESNALEEIMYAGFGPGGVGIVVEAVTGNRQRTAQEVRSTFERNGGRLAGPGSVTYLFKPTGEVVVKHSERSDPDQLLLLAADAGAEDVEIGKDESIVYCSVDSIEKVKEYLSSQGLEIAGSHISRRSTTTIKIENEKTAASILDLVNKLDDLADVQKVYANFDVPEEILQKEVA